MEVRSRQTVNRLTLAVPAPAIVSTDDCQNGAQGRNRTADTVIFSHVLYQLSYLGIRQDGWARQRRRSLTVATFAVHPSGIGRRPRNAVAFAEPFQEVSVLAAAAAKGRVRGRFGPAAERAGLRLIRRLRHTRPTW